MVFIVEGDTHVLQTKGGGYTVCDVARVSVMAFGIRSLYLVLGLCF